MGFPFVDPYEEAIKRRAEEAAAVAEAVAAAAVLSEEGGTSTGGSKESTPGSVEGGATKPRKVKRKAVIKVHKVTVDEVPGVGSCPDPYY